MCVLCRLLLIIIEFYIKIVLDVKHKFKCYGSITSHLVQHLKWTSIGRSKYITDVIWTPAGPTDVFWTSSGHSF